MAIRNRIKEYRVVRAGDIMPSPRNWRTHPKKQVAALKGVLEELGWADVGLTRELPDGTLAMIDGHCRQAIDPEEMMPVVVLDLDEDEANKLMTVLDPLAAMADSNSAALKSLLEEIQTDSDAVQAMLDGLAKENGITLDSAGDGLVDAAPQIDKAAELQLLWNTAVGQVWEIPGAGGTHRVMCGDSTKAEDVAKLLGDRKPFIMVTDPPYGVDYDPTFRSNNRTGLVTNDSRASWCESYKLFPGVVAYVWHGNLHVVTVADDLLNAGFSLRAYIIWKKPALVMGRGHYHWQHEPAFYGARGSSKWCGDRKQSTIWDIDHVHPTLGTTDDGQTSHGTQKPVECMARPIRNHGGAGDDVYDPFLGSGTTVIAAESLGRVAYGMEIEPGYTAVILQRCKDIGLTPVLVEE